MPQWDAGQYLLFEKQRTRPACDLAARLAHLDAGRVLDVGCGPGNSTRVLAQTFPAARITGIDSSPEMVAAATAMAQKAGLAAQMAFEVLDVTGDLAALGGQWDVVFSNACIQWVPNHQVLLPKLLGLLRGGGVLAVQTPLSNKQPIHAAVQVLAGQPRWAKWFPQPRWSHNLPPQYFDLLSGAAASFELWETDYFHDMPSHEAILEWYKGTGLRPFLQALPEEERPAFEAEVLAAVRRDYPAQKNGRVIFCFPRLFFTAVAN